MEDIFNPQNYEVFEKLGIVTLLVFILIKMYQYFKSNAELLQERINYLTDKLSDTENKLIELVLKSEENETLIIELLKKINDLIKN